MKAKDIVKYFSQLEPETNVCILWWEKPDYATEEGESEPTQETWDAVCESFNNSRSMDFGTEYISEWIADKVAEVEGEQQ